MPNVNKVVYGNQTLIDLTNSTLSSADQLAQGVTAYDRGGNLLTGTASGGTSAISVVDTTDSHGGTVRTITALDISDTTAIASDVAQGKYFYTAQGVKTQGAASGGGGGATQHEIHLEFTDSTDTDIDVYYDDPLISTMITSYEPATYGQKTVTLAQLDGVTWYEPAAIPIGVQLIDFTAVRSGYIVSENDGTEVASQWSCSSDFTLIDSNMTFSFIGYRWYSMVFYDENKSFVSSIQTMENISGATVDSNDYAHGSIAYPTIPSSAKYVRINSYPNDPTSSNLSLIRTA